jgi:chemotaxis protein methyltransferase CheR
MSKENLIEKRQIENPDSLLSVENIFRNNCLDITKYKMQFLKRRIERRMHIKEINDFGEYLSLLENDSHELSCLFESLSIHVTSFFRDTAVFNALRAVIMPKILSNVENTTLVNVWSAGCASGEEAYSIAILLNDLFEISKNIGISKNVGFRIRGTDINKKAINFAQEGKYPSKLLEHLSSDVKKKYFKKIEDHGDLEYEITPDMKNLVDFEYADILSSHENKYDIIFCRNVLIYYEKEAQEMILKKFYNYLKNDGYLIIGSDEVLLGKKLENIFYPIMPKEKIFQKINA